MLAVVAVLIGGALGTAVRAGLDLWIQHGDHEFPLDTLLINIVGSLLLGFLVARVWPVAPVWVRAGVGPGLLGGFTTFSAVMASMVTLAAGGQVLLALLYIVATLVLGFGAAALGLVLGRRRETPPIVEADE
ncbi:MAG TPA: CrcB family protein [Galbitalea sp.]|jgi:CrcB protein